MALTALQLAVHACLWISRVPGRGVVELDGTRLLVGPEADDNRIATIAGRRLVQLMLQRDDVSETRVRDEVARWGFQYVTGPCTPGCPPKLGSVQAVAVPGRKRTA